MKENILPAIRLTIVCILFFCGVYTLFIWGIAQVAPAKGKGEPVTVNGKVVGYKLIGQKFTDDKYFWSRPSAVDYNAAGSCGSNKGPTNPDYLKQVQDRIDSFLVHNPGIKKEEIPSELVTASGSGQDPDLSPAAAYVQTKRIAAVRNIPVEEINDLVKKHIAKPLAGLFGTERVNVLQLNIDLENLK
jgi:K+-transporting ATPase ATPase C chain